MASASGSILNRIFQVLAHSDRLTLLHMPLLFAVGEVAWPGASLPRLALGLARVRLARLLVEEGERDRAEQR